MHSHEEPLLILTELASIFAFDEKDAQLICAIKEKENIIRARHDAKQAEMKNTIKALTSDVWKSEMQLAAQQKESEERQLNDKIAALEIEKDLLTTTLRQHERNIKRMDW